jgi:predicted nucleic acid-binding protein
MIERQTVILLDTSAVVAAFRNIPEAVQRLEQARTMITSVVLAELYHGALKAAATTTEMNKIMLLLQTSVVVGCDQATARIFAQVRYDLEQQGNLIPLHDIWIAASALQYGVALATRDEHFERVLGLKVERW